MAVDMTETKVGLSHGKKITSMFYPYSAQGATDNGDWVDAKDWESIFADVTIATTATVSINGSNASTEPANTTHGFTLATALTATGEFKLEAHQIPRWVKIYVSSWTAGDVDVNMKVVRFVSDSL